MACRAKFFEEETGLQSADVALLVQTSAGWMTKQILDLKSTYARSAAVDRPTVLEEARRTGVADYEEWCTAQAMIELKAAQATSEQLVAKEAQWKPFIRQAE